MAVVSFTRATSYVPGSGDVQHRYYAEHASGLCIMEVWHPSGSFTNAPVFMVFHGGLGHKPGYRGMQLSTFGTDLEPLAALLSAAGWVVISCDYPACSSNNDSAPGNDDGFYAELFPVVDFFEQAYWQARAVSFVRDNWHGTAFRTIHGQALWGSGNSIDPDNVHLFTHSASATTGLVNALVPEGSYNEVVQGYGLFTERYAARSSHRPTSIIAWDGQPDWTQFYIDTGTTSSVGAIYQKDIHQMFNRKQSGKKWSETPQEIKKAGSPWWWLIEGNPQNKELPVLTYWSKSTNVEGANLTPSHWNPGTVLSNMAGGLAYVDPHHHFVAPHWGGEMANHLHPRSRNYWGDSSVNGISPIPANFHNTMFEWLQGVKK